MSLNVKNFDAADFLQTPEDIKEFVSEAAKTGDVKHFLHCLGIAARAKGMTEVAKNTGLTRASLYKSLDENANPKFDTIVKVLTALDCKISVS